MKDEQRKGSGNQGKRQAHLLSRAWDFDGPLVQAPVISSNLGDPGRRGQRVHVRVHRVPMFIHFTIKGDYISLHGDDGGEQNQIYDHFMAYGVETGL